MFWKQISAVLFCIFLADQWFINAVIFDTIFIFWEILNGGLKHPPESISGLFQILLKKDGNIQIFNCDFAKITNIFIGCFGFQHQNSRCQIGSDLSTTSKFYSWIYFSLSWFGRFVYNFFLNQLFVYYLWCRKTQKILAK